MARYARGGAGAGGWAIKGQRGARPLGTALRYAGPEVLSRTVGFFLLPAFAFAMGATEFGLYTLARTLAQLVTAALPLGTDQWLTYRLIREDDDTVSHAAAYGTVASLTGVGGIVVVGLTGAAGQLDQVGRAGLWILAVATGAISAGGGTLPAVVARAHGRPNILIESAIARSVTRLGTGIPAILVFGGGATAGMTVELVGVLVAAVVAYRHVPLSWPTPWSRSAAREALAYGLPLVPHSVAHWVLNLGDRWILGMIAGPAAVGVYGLSYQLASPVYLMATAGNDVLISRYGRLADDALVRKRVKVYPGVVLAAAIAMCVAWIPVSTLLPGAQYEAARPVFPVVALGLAQFGPYYVAASLRLFVTGSSRGVWMPTSVAALMNIVANLLLIPQMGVLGAAVATALAYSVLTFGQLRLSSALEPMVQEVRSSAIHTQIVTAAITFAVVIFLL